MRLHRYFSSKPLLLVVIIFIFTFLGKKSYAVGADCKDGCDDYIPGYGEEWMSSDNYCCTGGGCPSWACKTAGYTAKICTPGYFTCCANSDTNCSFCNNAEVYAITWGTCDFCGGGDDGGTTTYPQATIEGRIWEDINCNGVRDFPTESWGTYGCSYCTHVYNYFAIARGGSPTAWVTWACDSMGRKFISGPLDIGRAGWDYVTLWDKVDDGHTTLPPGYDCKGYYFSSSKGTDSGTDCRAGYMTYNTKLAEGSGNYLYFQIGPEGYTCPGPVMGRIWTDSNLDGIYSGLAETWSPTSSTCASTLKWDNFALAVGGVGQPLTWGCNDSPLRAYYQTPPITTGSGKVFTMSVLPTGYTCAWSYNSSPYTSGCTTTGLTVNAGNVNHLWWKITPPSSTGRVTGRIWTDSNLDGIYSGLAETWSPTSSTCASTLKWDNFALAVGGVGQPLTWGCNDSPLRAYYRTPNVIAGSGKIAALSGLPTGYTCAWSYNSSPYTSGCTTTGLTVNSGDTNNLLWRITPPPAVTGWISGFVWTDSNLDGIYSGLAETWSPTSSTCASTLKWDNFALAVGGVGQPLTWGCNDSPLRAYYRTPNVIAGSGKIAALSGLPTGYTCAWSYKGGSYTSGCTASGLTVSEGVANDLRWRITPPVPTNAAPTVSFSPNSFSYSVGSTHPSKVNISDPNTGGSMNIKASFSFPENGTFYSGTLEVRAYGTPLSGQYPIVRVYGWDKTTGNRVLLNTFTVGATASSYNTSVASPNYSFFDVEFTNDGWIDGVGDRNLYVDYVRYISWGNYMIQAENSSLVSYDREDPGDFFDVVTPTTSISGGATYAYIDRNGSLRLPVVWKSSVLPVNAVPGNITFTVQDNGNLGSNASITTTPITRVASGYLWTTDSSADCDPMGVRNSIYAGATISMRDGDVGYVPRTGVVSSDGTYSISGFFGRITNICVTGLPTGHSIACNNTYDVGMGGCFGASYDGPSNNIINIGVKESIAKRWVAAYNGDVYAATYTLTLPLSQADSKLKPYFPSGVSSSYYVIGYNQPSSTVFSESVMNVGTNVYSESNISATKLGYLGPPFRQRNKVFLQDELKNWVKDMSNNNSYIIYSLYSSFSDRDVKVYKTSSIPNNYNYNVSDDGIAVLVVPAEGNDKTLNISNVTAVGTGRLMIITDRDVVIGAQSIGSDPDFFLISKPAHIQASIITSGNITVVNGPSPVYTLVAEGPLVARYNLTVSRDPGSAVNELMPAFFVKYNPNYVLRLNNIAVNGLVPVLRPLFNFDFSQEEK